jgi:hypothetical protein
MAISDELVESLATSGQTLNITEIYQKLTGSGLHSEHFCWLPSLCDKYPDNFDLGFAVEFEGETHFEFHDANQFSFSTDAARLIVNKGDELLHDFTMNEITALMTLFVNEHGSLDGELHDLHFKSGTIVTPTKLLVNHKDIGWIGQTFMSL